MCFNELLYCGSPLLWYNTIYISTKQSSHSRTLTLLGFSIRCRYLGLSVEPVWYLAKISLHFFHSISDASTIMSMSICACCNVTITSVARPPSCPCQSALAATFFSFVLCSFVGQYPKTQNYPSLYMYNKSYSCFDKVRPLEMQDVTD